MNYLKKILYTIMIVACASACDNYLDVNTDPNSPLAEDVDPTFVLAGAQTTTGANFSVTMNRLGNLMNGSWGGNVVFSASPFAQEYRYDITSTFYSGIWDNLYVRTANFTNIINFESDIDYTNHKAISKILRAFYFQYLVDLYGDIPYFDKHQLTEILQPTYDEDSVVYQDLLNEVNSAINMIDNVSDSAIPVANEDAIYGGNMSMWRKFANTLKLRILLRQSNVPSAQSTIANELSGLTSADFIGLGDAAVLNPGYSNDNNKQNPFYSNYGFDTAGNPTFLQDTVVASEYLVQLLNGTLNGAVDNRLTAMFRTNNDGNYVGAIPGQLLGDYPGGTTFSKLGNAYGVNGPNAAGASMGLNIFTISESLLLQAEAIERGYLTGNAEVLFDSAIAQSYSLFGAGSPASYLTAISGINGLDYTGSTNDKIEAIITQKYIALNGINGLESWIEMTRTGFPNAPLTTTQTSGMRPVRLLYPFSEIAGNTVNVPTQTTSDVFSDRIFWNQ